MGIYRKIRDFLFRFVNKKFLIFLFFLALSGVFWMVQALNETLEKEIAIPVVITNVPKNVVITSDVADTLRVTVRDKGYTLAAYFYGNRIHPVMINFANYGKNDGHVTISSADLQRMAYQQLYGSTRITAIKPEKLNFYYNNGSNKAIPVKFSGNVTAGRGHFIANMSVYPREVVVYASDAILDSLRFAATETFNLSGVTDTVRREVTLQKINGVKFVPETVLLTVFADVLTEKTVEVPVVAKNMPEGKSLRTFPARVTVKFVVGANQFSSITENDFKVIADYKEIEAGASDKCKLRIAAKPDNVSKVTLETQEVDYLIEQQ